MPPRRPTHAEPASSPILSLEQMHICIDQLNNCIVKLEAFDPKTARRRHSASPEVAVLQISITEALVAAFGQNTPQYNLYSRATKLDNGPLVMRTGSSWIQARGGYDRDVYDEAHEAQQYLSEGKEMSLALLRQAVNSLKDDVAKQEKMRDVIPLIEKKSAPSLKRKVFIVHGHEDGPREAVAHFVRKIGFEPIILHEQANQGKTIIEKVEAHGDVGFAVVLLTPDDEGSAKGGTLQPRARQNVILELGYFIGRLGRERVCALKSGDVEIPSDYSGVVYEPFDKTGGWKQKLGRELEVAGYTIDWNEVMRS